MGGVVYVMPKAGEQAVGDGAIEHAKADYYFGIAMQERYRMDIDHTKSRVDVMCEEAKKRIEGSNPLIQARLYRTAEQGSEQLYIHPEITRLITGYCLKIGIWHISQSRRTHTYPRDSFGESFHTEYPVLVKVCSCGEKKLVMKDEPEEWEYAIEEMETLQEE